MTCPVCGHDVNRRVADFRFWCGGKRYECQQCGSLWYPAYSPRRDAIGIVVSVACGVAGVITMTVMNGTSQSSLSSLFVFLGAAWLVCIALLLALVYTVQFFQGGTLVIIRKGTGPPKPKRALGTFGEGLGASVLVGVVAGLAAHYLTNGRMTFGVFIVAYVLLFSGLKGTSRWAGIVIFTAVAALVVVLFQHM